MTKLLYLLSTCLAGLATFAMAQNAASSAAGAYPIKGSGSSDLMTMAPPVAPMPMSSSMMMSSMMSMATSHTTTAMMTTPTTTMMNNVITVLVTIDITIIEVFMGGSTTTMTMAMPPMPTGVTHQVTVGGVDDIYSPNSVVAAVGDIIEFVFTADNHTLTQSSFNSPCIKAIGGIDTGFMTNINGTVSPPPTFKLQVTTTTALFFFCAQMGHCGEGMVFSINPTANMTEAMFIAKAQSMNGTMTMTSATVKATTMMTMTTTHATTTTSVAVATPSLVQGTGTIIGGQCNCACLCGVTAFPAGDGIGAFGGLSGMAPQAALASVAVGMPPSMALT